MKFSGKCFSVIALMALGLFLILRLFGAPSKSNAGASHASLNVGKTETHNNMTSGTSSSSSDNSTFNARHVLFLINSNLHPLNQRVQNLVAQGLKDFPQIEKLETASASSPQGAESPDLFLRVDLVELKEEGVLSRTLKATVTASLGNAPWQSHHFTQSGSTPPVVQFSWNGTLEHESKFSGVRTDRYQDAARDIAEQLLKGMTNEMKNLSKKYPALPELPREFYGPYELVNDFGFLKAVIAQRAYSHHGLFTHNETFWKFQTTTNPVPQLQHIIEQFEAAGWKAETSSLTNTSDYYLHFAKKGEALEIFRAERERLDIASLEKKENSIPFIVHYEKPFSDAEREAALEKLFVANSPMETLLPFQNSFFPKQRERYYALLEKSSPTAPRGYLLLAEHYLHRKDTNTAVKMLLRAKALRATLDSSDLDAQIDELAKRISPKEKLKLDVTPELYREFGFLEITNAPQTFEMERAFGQPVLLFLNDKRGPETFCLTIGAPQKGNYPWNMIETQGYGRSSTASESPLPANGDWQQSFTFGKCSLMFTAHLLPDGKRFKYSIKTK